jgi:plastocyanin
VRRAVIGGIALVVCLAGCGGDDGASSSTPRVEAQDFRFSIPTVHVPVGDSVEWDNTGRTEHTVKGPGFFSRAIEPGGTYRHRFTRPGSYSYGCTLHPDAMRGRVIVEG